MSIGKGLTPIYLDWEKEACEVEGVWRNYANFVAHFKRKQNTSIMTTLLLVRHGETVDNAAQIMQGQRQGELNAVGRQQALDLSRRLASRHIDAFVASDLRRSVDTCRLLAEPHGADVVTTPLLRERDWGGFTGRYIPSLKNEPWPSDVETLEAMKDRARAFLDFIESQYAGQTVVAVGHGIINKAIQSVFYDKPMNEIERMANAEVRTLEIGGKQA